MRALTFFLSTAFIFCVLFETVSGQYKSDFSLRNFEISLERQRSRTETGRSSQIKDVSVFGKNSGVVFTDDALFRTDDGGANWREIALSKSDSEIIGAVSFTDENTGWTILSDIQNARLELLKTNDGGNSWTRSAITLRKKDLEEAGLQRVSLRQTDNLSATLTLRLQSSSNFIRQAIYKTRNGGQTWEFERTFADIKTSDNVEDNENSAWKLKQEGKCEGFKIGCVQESKIFAGDKEITPPQIKELSRIEKSQAKLEAANSVFATAPGGAVRTSLNLGFDKCTAATVAQMQTWWDNSPYSDANIYISGRNRGCSQAQLNASWVNQISAMGWGLIPTIVGYQSPCSVCTSCAKLSYDTATAETQGRGEADIAITDANNLGLTQGTVLYYDMERYDETTATAGCRVATSAFLRGWTDRLKERGYVSGTYGSPFNAAADWVNIPEASRMQAVWLARWDGNPNVWLYAGTTQIPVNYWSNLQRIKQYLNVTSENWGGVAFGIDRNKAEGPVAGVAAAKNKAADFDGDGKSDISVYRPEIGAWFILYSANSSFGAFNFGVAEDILVPGDYDGNGKTDYAVYRPSTGSWYIQNRFFRAEQFGAPEDIPVPADYNGDGFTDIAVFRPSSGAWYISNSSGAVKFRAEIFGASGDKPVPGDYDGDGKADIAVFRPSDGVWYIMRSTAGFTSMQFGISTDKPVQSDYDGDGKTDIAVFRDGNWYLMRSTAGFFGMQFGFSTDKPAPADFDGDGKSDIAVYRDGNWYLWQSQNGFASYYFGSPTDRTVPSAYIP